MKQYKIWKAYKTHYKTLSIRKSFFYCFMAFIGLYLIHFLNQKFEQETQIYLIGSFGATVVLLFGVPHSPLSNWKNCLGGHLISAIIGVTCVQLLGKEALFVGPLAVALSIFLMTVTNTLHPPGGATALIAVMGGKNILDLGYSYVLSPVLSGVLVLLLLAKFTYFIQRRLESN